MKQSFFGKPRKQPDSVKTQHVQKMSPQRQNNAKNQKEKKAPKQDETSERRSQADKRHSQP